MKSRIDKLTSKIDLMVLGLVLEKPMHGYEINQVIGSEEMYSWLDISRTSVYYALARLKKQGFIAEVVEKQYNKPDRSVYRITETGRELFFDSLEWSLAEQEKVFLEYNVGLFFINKLTKEKAYEVLEKRKRFVKKWQKSLKEQLKLVQDDEEYSPTLKAVIDHTLSFAEHEASWLDDFIKNTDSSFKKSDSASVFSLSGNLEDTQLADVIRTIASGMRTGTLSLRYGLDEIMITFVEGKVRYMAGSPVSRGESTKGDSSDDGSALSDILTVFNWPQGKFVFTPDLIIDEGGVAVEIESCSLILAGCRFVDDWGRVKKVIPSSDAIYKLSDSLDNHLIDKMSINSAEEAVLSQINGIRSIKRLAALTSTSIFDISRMLYAFVICGLVVPVSKDKSELFNILKLFSDAFFERLIAVKAKKIAEQIEGDLNNLADKRKMPFSLDNFKLVDNANTPQDLGEFAHLAKEFYAAQINAIRSQLGDRFTHHVLESIMGQLTPELHSIYNRYGLNDVS
ncbi:MAG: helix-turn-helix transcriptional regulator [Actinobacteria bacterium]|nr:helix-turn-helix transcriptional regulator [Actinomycetota bacterium]